MCIIMRECLYELDRRLTDKKRVLVSIEWIETLIFEGLTATEIINLFFIEKERLEAIC